MAQLGGVSGSGSLFSFQENAVDSPSSSESEDEDQEALIRRVLTPDLVASSPSGEKTWFKRFGGKGSAEKGSLSIQSGDIVRSSTPSSPSTPTGSKRPSSRSAMMAAGSGSGSSTTSGISSKEKPSSPLAKSVQSSSLPQAAASSASATEGGFAVIPSSTYTSSPSTTDTLLKPRGGCYGFFFPIIHALSKYLFFSPPCCQSPKFRLPVGSVLVLLGDVIIFGICLALIFTVYFPQVNISIRAFGIPNHPSQMNFDAFDAAQHKRYTNESIDGYKMSHVGVDKGIVKRDAGVPSPKFTYPYSDNCDPNDATQFALHINWEMDLLFRVPEGNPDDNILRLDRIAYIHQVEETVYNSSAYQNFCHKRQTNICDPLNSLLTWLYPRDQKTGNYVYDTPDHFTPDLQATLQSLSAPENRSIALWFTGGAITFVNSSHADGKILRSQIRVGLPFPCFSSTQDRKEEQKDLVTQYFVSLMPVFDELSTSEVEILYGGSIIFDYQINSAVLHDAVLGCASVVMVIILVFILSGFSIWMTLMGLYSIISCFCPAYLVYTCFFKYESVGLLNIISLFVVIGIGVDDVFVFINTFKQSARLPNLQTSLERITHTIMESTKATFFTSLTTAVAFFANAISSIPAVQQFGIFMALVVIFCFLQVFIVIPHSLFIWDCFFLRLENFCYSPFSRIWRRREEEAVYSTLPNVRMSDLAAAEAARDEDDSGIDSNSNSMSDNISNTSSQSDESVIAPIALAERVASPEESRTLMVTSTSLSHYAGPVESVGVVRLEPEAVTFERKLTMLMQKVMFYVSIVPMTLNLLVSRRKEKYRKKSAKCLLSVGHVLVTVFILMVIVGVSLGLLLQLRFDDKPPQFFDPDSNVQKMLDLAGNVTDSSEVNCYNCSAWNLNFHFPTAHDGGSSTGGGTSGGSNGGSSNGGSNGGSTGGSNSGGSTGGGSNGGSTGGGNTGGSTGGGNSGGSTGGGNSGGSTGGGNNGGSTGGGNTGGSTGGGNSGGSTGGGNNGGSTGGNTGGSTGGGNTGGSTTTTASSGGSRVTTTKAPPPLQTTKPTSSSGSGGGNKVSNSRYINNVPVYVVFGIERVERHYDPTHVLDTEGDQSSAVLDLSFSDVFKCPTSSSSSPDPRLKGAMRALCRICANISNSNLTLDRNFQCFPLQKSLLRSLSCVLDLVGSLPECAAIPPSSSHSVSAKADAKETSDGEYTKLLYFAMAFKSTTNEGGSPFAGTKDYTNWTNFLSNELSEIKKRSGPSQEYEGAEVIMTAFQTSEYWVQVNVETVAVYGSFYGILISLILCSLVVVVLSHDFRIVVSMVTTILVILISLGGLFWCFGWRLGIVEAISLSILVGNSLDYCIHLSEGFVAMDARHVAFVERFKFTAGAPLRVKRVMAAISFIGVSILSSAITTILAILPLLGTSIQLFKRFGEILLLDTAVAILYTLLICSNCLAFFGPPISENWKKKLANAVSTILGTVVFYGLMFMALYVAYKYFDIYIPSPQGGQLFG